MWLAFKKRKWKKLDTITIEGYTLFSWNAKKKCLRGTMWHHEWWFSEGEILIGGSTDIENLVHMT